MNRDFLERLYARRRFGMRLGLEAMQALLARLGNPEAGLAAVPGSSFFKDFEDRFIRFHFAKRDETLREAGDRLLRLRGLWEESGQRAESGVKKAGKQY